MPCGCVKTTVVWIENQVSRIAVQRSRLLSKSPADLHRGLRSSKIWLSYQSNLVAFRMRLHNCRCFQEHLRLLSQRLRAHCVASGGSGSVQKYLEAQVRSPRVSGRIACCFRTNSHFADEGSDSFCLQAAIAFICLMTLSCGALCWVAICAST